MRKMLLGLLLCLCMGRLLLPAGAMAEAGNQLITMEPGQTLDVGTFDQATTVSGYETLVSINEPGTYTLTGYADGAYQTGRILVNSDCTLVLDRLNFNSCVQTDYYGGTQGAIEIADEKKVTIQLEGSNRLVCSKFYAPGTTRAGIMLGLNSTVTISGSGSMEIHSNIGRRMQRLDGAKSGYLVMDSGLLQCSYIGNATLPRGETTEGLEISSPLDMNITHNGGVLYMSADDGTDKQNYTYNRANGAIYRIRILTSGATKIRRGLTGEWMPTASYNGYVYQWLDYSGLHADTPLVYYVQSTEGYHRYTVPATADKEYYYDAALDDTKSIGGVAGTLKDGLGTTYADSTLTFTAADGQQTSCTTGADGSYACTLLPSDVPYIVSVEIGGQTYRLGSVEVPDDQQVSKDFTLSIVTGIVTKKEDNTPIEGVLVQITDDSSTYTTLTNNEGKYTLLIALAEGKTSVDLSATRLGYNTVTKPNESLTSNHATVNFALEGSDTLPDPILIYSEAELVYLSQLESFDLFKKTVSLQNDIHMSDTSAFQPINSQSNMKVQGNGYTISNLHCALFEELWSSSFENLHLQGNIVGDNRVGAFMQHGSATTFNACSVTGTLNSSNRNGSVGGFLGYVSSSGTLKFINCTAAIAITGAGENIGGLVGYGNHLVNVENCAIRLQASVTPFDYLHLGAVVGCMYDAAGEVSTLTVKNTYASLTKDDGIDAYAVADPVGYSNPESRIITTDYFYDSTTLLNPQDNPMPEGTTGMAQSLMTALPGTEGALIDKLSQNVTGTYKPWYPQRDGFPGFTPTYAVNVTGGTLETGTATTAYYSQGETVTVAAAPAAGNRFTGWTVAPETVALSDASAQTVRFTMPDETVTLTTNTEPLEAPSITPPTASAIKLSQSLAKSTLTGGSASLNGTTVEGTFAWKYDSTVPALSDSKSTGYEVVFTPNDLSACGLASCLVTVEVLEAYRLFEPPYLTGNNTEASSQFSPPWSMDDQLVIPGTLVTITTTVVGSSPERTGTQSVYIVSSDVDDGISPEKGYSFPIVQGEDIGEKKFIFTFIMPPRQTSIAVFGGYTALTAPESVTTNGLTASVAFGPIAEEEIITATLTLSGIPEETGWHTVGLSSVKVGSITAPAKTRLAVTKGEEVSQTFTFTFPMPEGGADDFVLTNRFDLHLYTVTLRDAASRFDRFTCQIGSAEAFPYAAPFEVYDGDKLILTAAPRRGYTFAQWAAGQTANPLTIDSVTASVDFSPTCTPNTYTVHYNGNGSTGGATADSRHTYDQASALTANGFVRRGMSFVGWAESAGASKAAYTDGQSVTNLSATQGATIELYALWADKQAITLTPDSVSTAYDGAAHPLRFLTSPAGLTGFATAYKLSGAEDTAYTDSEPVHAGSYDVRITRPEDATCQEFTQVVPSGVVIAPASVAAVTVTGVAVPLPGNAPADTASCTTPGVTIADVSWSPDDPTFQLGKSYTVEVKLTADADHAFAAAEKLSATLNAFAVTDFSRLSDTALTIRYAFPAVTTITITVSPSSSFRLKQATDLAVTVGHGTGITVDDLVDVRIDDKELLRDIDYTAETSESILVTLKAAYLNTLPAGSHALRVNLRGGAGAETTLTAASIPPKTGDSSHPLLWSVLLTLAIGMMIACGDRKRRSSAR